MNQTKNYKLNQWAMTDRIQMKDFNADNAKLESALSSLASRDSSLDAAIAAAKKELRAELAAAKAELAAEIALKSQWVTMIDSDFGNGEKSHVFDVSQMDLGHFYLLSLEVTVPLSNVLVMNSLRLSGEFIQQVFEFHTSSKKFFFIPTKDPASFPVGRSYTGSEYLVLAQTYQDVGKLQFVPKDSGYNITGTCHFRLLGLK